MTTVRIDRETKKILWKIGAELQAKRGEKITFNEIIQFLIKQYNKGEREAVEELFGILSDADLSKARDLVQQLRKEGYERVKSLERSFSD